MQFSKQTVLGLVTYLAFIGVVLTCPEGHGCFRYPAGCGDTGAATCDTLVAWREIDANTIQFYVRGKNNGTEPRWLAIGFSTDGEMGDDDILLIRQTSTDTGMVVLEHYWSIGPPSLDIVKETADLSEDGLTVTMATFEDGYIVCNFTRAVSVEGNDHIYDLAETAGPDMMPKYYWFFGTGPVQSDTALQHEKDPYHTKAGVNFTVTGDVMVEEGSSSSSEEGGSSEEDAASNIVASVMIILAMTCLAIYLN